MLNSYIPKASEQEFCEGINLCSVRRQEDWITKVWVKYIDKTQKEDSLTNIIDQETYEWKQIIRIYSSGHIFLNKELTSVFLITTEKNWKTQHQFTWWSPKELENQNVIFKDNWVYKFNLHKVRENARIRTQNRTWVKIISEYNETPIVDWALLENEENWEKIFRLVCLMHFIVNNYEWKIWCTWKEDSIDWKWYKINELDELKSIAPNVKIVTSHAIKYIKENYHSSIQ